MEALLMVLGVLSLVIGIGNLVCWILVIVSAFQKEESPLLGILSIVLCALGGFIIGWVKHKEWGIQKLMVIWSILFVASLLIQLATVALSVALAGTMEGAPGPGFPGPGF